MIDPEYKTEPLRRRISELEARANELGHAYDVTFKRRTELELMLVQLLGDLDAEFGAQRVDVNWPKLRELAKT
jgi:hypothetical protein